MFKNGDKLKSKINKIFDGYYLVTGCDEKNYELTSYELDDTKPFQDRINPSDYGVYVKSKKWVEKNMYKIGE